MQKNLNERLKKCEEFLLGFLNVPREEYMNDPAACALYLERTRALAKLLGNPHNDFKFIHVAGTSGKGSTVHFIESILRAHGMRVGAYISPHITTMAERFRINGRLAPMHDLENAIELLKPAVQKFLEHETYSVPSLFEIDFLLALLIFKMNNTEWVVLETGCGGRYDSTNIIPAPHVAVITTIGLDHMEILGDTKEKIAYEKVGIVKKGSHVVIGEQNKKIKKMLADWATKASAASIICVTPPHILSLTPQATTFSTENKESYTIHLIGKHQAHNATVAATVATLLSIPPKTIRKGLKNTFAPCVFEIAQEHPLVVLDGAHNEDKIKSTRDALIMLQKAHPNAHTHLIMGMSHNKQIDACLKQLIPMVDFFYPTRFTKNVFRKACDPRDLAARAKKIKKIPTKPYLFPIDALQSALHNSKKYDIVLVTGSIFLAGELRAQWFSEEKILSKRALV